MRPPQARRLLRLACKLTENFFLIEWQNFNRTEVNIECKTKNKNKVLLTVSTVKTSKSKHAPEKKQRKIESEKICVPQIRNIF